jgi:hypothetical protein
MASPEEDTLDTECNAVRGSSIMCDDRLVGRRADIVMEISYRTNTKRKRILPTKHREIADPELVVEKHREGSRVMSNDRSAEQILQ